MPLDIRLSPEALHVHATHAVLQDTRACAELCALFASLRVQLDGMAKQYTQTCLQLAAAEERIAKAKETLTKSEFAAGRKALRQLEGEE